MKLRVVSFILLVFLSITFFRLPALATISIDGESVFTKQKTSIECPLASTVSMLRRRAIIDGKENWNTTYSYAKIKATAWIKCMSTSFRFPSENDYKVYSHSMDLELDLKMGDIEEKKQYFINKLKNHPEGIAAYVFFLKTPKRAGHLKSHSGKSEQHVILITDYDKNTDTFYCFDPARNMPSGRIELAKSSLSKYIKNAGYWNDSESIQNNILGYIAQTWMITNVSGGGSNTNAPEMEHSAHTYNDEGYCTIGGEEYAISLQAMTATTYQAINDNTPVRWRPYKPEPIIDRLSKDTSVTVVANGKNAKGNLWYKLDNGMWVYSENVRKSGKPSTPRGITVTKASKSTAQLSWNASAGATSYVVQYRSPTSNGWRTDPDYRGKKLTSYITTGLAANRTYQFQVCAVNSVGVSGWAEVEYLNTSTATTPPKPEFYVLSADDEDFTVTVPADYTLDCYQTPTATNRYAYIAAKMASYDLNCAKRLRMSDGTTRCLSISGDDNEFYFVYTDAMTISYPELQVGTATIRYNANGGRGAPASYSAKKDSYGIISFSLSTTKPTRSGYTFLGWRFENSTDYGIDNPGQGIAIDTCSAFGDETFTYYAQWKSASEKPATPANFTVNWKNAGTATVSWSPVTGAISYEVEFWSRSWNEWRADYEYSFYLGTQTTSYTTSGLSNHSSYEFRVRAKNANGNSDWTYFTYKP